MNKQDKKYKQMQKLPKKPRTQLSSLLRCLSHLAFWVGSFCLFRFPLSYLTWLQPHFSQCNVHTPPLAPSGTPFSTLTCSLTAAVAPWKCMEMDPSFVCTETGLLFQPEPCLKSEARCEGGRKKTDKRNIEKKQAGPEYFKDFVCIPCF